MCDCELLLFSPYRFARVGDNYILRSDPEEQTFRVRRVVRHHLFDPLREDGGGDGRHDIALVFLKPRRDGTARENNNNVSEYGIFPHRKKNVAKNRSGLAKGRKMSLKIWRREGALTAFIVR